MYRAWKEKQDLFSRREGLIGELEVLNFLLLFLS
jgi:hypothetical protein